MIVWIYGEAPTKGPLKRGKLRNKTNTAVHSDYIAEKGLLRTNLTRIDCQKYASFLNIANNVSDFHAWLIIHRVTLRSRGRDKEAGPVDKAETRNDRHQDKSREATYIWRRYPRNFKCIFLLKNT